MEQVRASSTPFQDEPSLGELFSDLSASASTLVRQEIELAKVEMTRKANKAARNSVLVLVGGLLGFAALLTLIAAVVLMLAQVMDAWLAALIVGVVLAIVAGILTTVGINKLKEIEPMPKRAITTLREDKEWLAQQI